MKDRRKAHLERTNLPAALTHHQGTEPPPAGRTIHAVSLPEMSYVALASSVRPGGVSREHHLDYRGPD